MRPAREARRWRLLRLGVVLGGVVYLATRVAAFNAGIGYPYTFQSALLLLELGLLAALAGLGVASARRRFDSGSVRWMWALALTALAVSALLGAMELLRSWFEVPALWSLRSLAGEITAGYWHVLFVFLWLAFFTWLHRPARKLVGSLLVIPLFVWGLQATLNLAQAFDNWHFDSVSVTAELYWYATAVTAVALIVLVLLLVGWRRAFGAERMSIGSRLAAGVTVITVFTEFVAMLFLISVWSVRSLETSWEESEKRSVEHAVARAEREWARDSCRVGTLLIGELDLLEAPRSELDQVIRPLLIGCREKLATVSSDEAAEIRRLLLELPRDQIQLDLNRGLSAERRRQLANLVNCEIGRPVAMEVVLGVFFSREKPPQP